MYDEFRKDLDGLINSWDKRLEKSWQDILSIKSDAHKDPKKLALIIEYNRFKDLHTIMKRLRDDTEALTRYSQKINTIWNSLKWKQEHDSVADDIEQIVQETERLLVCSNAVLCIKARSNVELCIRCIKAGGEVIPIKKQDELINRLNYCIISLNKLGYGIGKGIIIQLHEDKDYVVDVAININVSCTKCSHVMDCYGGVDCDLYAPEKCARCGSFEITRHSGIPPLAKESAKCCLIV